MNHTSVYILLLSIIKHAQKKWKIESHRTEAKAETEKKKNHTEQKSETALMELIGFHQNQLCP